MRRLGALVLLLVLAAKTAVPAELTPIARENKLGVDIKGIALPATFPKDLVSGLTNTLLVHVALFSDSQRLDQKIAAIAIKYDLWDETFALTMTINDVVVSVRANSTKQQIDVFLADLQLPDLFATSEVPKGRSATLRVDMLLNPIERERIEALKKWVAENSTYTPADTTGFGDKRVGSSRSNAIFNKIFEQYARGANVAATWTESLSSEPFKIAGVDYER
jgi:hypothetical protein